MERKPQPDARLIETVSDAIEKRLAASEGLVVVGIAGAQGSGKTTLAAALVRRFGGAGVATAALSLDDLYLTRAERLVLAGKVHPLLVTRGPPGTHDVALGLHLLAALERGEPALLPSFDKARDNRAPLEEWYAAPEGTRLLVLEGWCLGAAPQDERALAEPVNALEHDEDPQAVWRRYANAMLAGDYQRLFAQIDPLVFLAAPDFEVVHKWRSEQEADLLRRDPLAPQAMDSAALARFIQHYERLTRHMLEEMPSRADITAWLDENRKVLRISERPTSSPAR